MAITETFARTWFPPIILGAIVADVLIFLFRVFRRASIPDDPHQLPPGIAAHRDGDTVTVHYRWGSGWSVLMLLLLLIAMIALALDALAEQRYYHVHPAAAVAFCVIFPVFVYILLLNAFNRTIYTLTPARISSRNGPLPSLGKPVVVDLAGIDRIVCRLNRAYSQYSLYVDPHSGPKRTIIDRGNSAGIAVALARLISEMHPSVRLDFDL